MVTTLRKTKKMLSFIIYVLFYNYFMKNKNKNNKLKTNKCNIKKKQQKKKT